MMQSYLKAALHYNPETGEFTWLERPRSHFPSSRAHNAWNRRYAGKPAGHVADNGYRTITLAGRSHKAHRLAFLYMHGEMPSEQIDHKNGDRADNRFENLREATASENAFNRWNLHGSSGAKGVSRHKKTGKWQARIGLNGKSIYLGLFDSLEAAKTACEGAAQQHYGDFARSL